MFQFILHLQLKRGPDIIHCDLEGLIPERIKVSEEDCEICDINIINISKFVFHTYRQSCSCTPACLPLQHDDNNALILQMKFKKVDYN